MRSIPISFVSRLTEGFITRRAALDTLLPYFTSIVLEEQDCFGSEKGYEALLEFIPDVKVADSLRKTWSADPTKPSASKWLDLKAEVKAKDRSQRAPLMHAMEDIILHYTYPRIDAEVSKHRNHLLKAPFCIHPKTGRVCVPVDPRGIDSFDPERVPTIGQLLGELDEGMVVEGEEPSPDSDVQRTSLAPYVEMMNKYATSLMDLKRKAKQDPGACSFLPCSAPLPSVLPIFLPVPLFFRPTRSIMFCPLLRIGS